ncbi:BAR domain-containing protein [Parerythrobacter jejuensis]|uniref:Uncharacterized protein n=1 Tax=Parerythrobacter jejuensis TaxID=795812 RepID=A0A845AR80_9SPHN|nr:hypothetical protein [Parerythrobacter jejuensis]MXP31989.1 hypothetical protein [Parerythrobacter jejuensis]
MDPQQVQSLMQSLQTAGQFPKTPFQAPAAGDDLKSRQFEYSDFHVEFAKVHQLAIEKGATGFGIIADTIIFDADSHADLKDPIELVTLIARRIVVKGGGKARIVLDHAKANSILSVNIIAGDISSGLELVSKSSKEQAYDLSEVKAPHNNSPQMHRFGWRNGKVRVGEKTVPIGYLTWDQPLYQVLNASYALAAGALGGNDSNHGNIALATDLLRWIMAWSGVQSDIANLTSTASAVLRIMPTPLADPADPDAIAVSMPPLTSDAYVQLAKSRLDLASQVELDGKLAAQSGSADAIAKQFAKALAKRDRITAKALADQITETRARAKSAQNAFEKAGEILEKQKFESELAKIHLDLANELDRIEKIAKASIEIAISLITLGTSIAALAMGAPGDPGASTKKGQEGVTGLIEAVKKAGSSAGSWSKWYNVLSVYLLPITFLIEHGGDHGDNIKKIGTASLAIKNAALTIYGSRGAQKNIEAIAKTVGEAVQALAAKPQTAEARAAWDAIEIETVNMLDVGINDSNTAGPVKTAMAAYKTSVQKVALYGRFIIEQQGKRDEIDRHLGALVLQRIAEIKKAETFDTLINRKPDKAELMERIEAESAHSLDEARQAFFEASYGFRRAQYYETYSFPNATPTYCENAAAMARIHTEIVTDHKNAPRGHRDFNRTFVVDDPATLERLQLGEPVRIEVPIDYQDFAGYSHLRLSRMEIRAKTSAAVSGVIGISMDSGSQFLDRRHDEPITIDGEQFNVKFEYDPTKVQLSNDFEPVMPPPFSTWTLQIYRPDTIPKLDAVHIEMIGQSGK